MQGALLYISSFRHKVSHEDKTRALRQLPTVTYIKTQRMSTGLLFNDKGNGYQAFNPLKIMCIV